MNKNINHSKQDNTQFLQVLTSQILNFIEILIQGYD